MPSDSLAVESSFPQTGANRTCVETLRELANYVGNEDDVDLRIRARRAFDSAVREFNDVGWKFNRLVQDIDLSTPVVGTLGEYDLAATIFVPIRAVLVDSSGDVRDRVPFVPWEEWVIRFPAQKAATGSVPQNYTVRNIHETGRLIVDPPLKTTSLTHPTLRLHYLRRIAICLGDDDRLQTPPEIDEAIFQLARAKLVHMEKGVREASDEYVLARDMKTRLEHQHRDFPDFEIWD